MKEEKVDINQAGIPEFAALPRIGEKLAEKIIEYREDHKPFKDVTDLADVPGVSDQMVRELADYLVVKEVEAKTPSVKEESSQLEQGPEEKAVSDDSPMPQKRTVASEKQLLGLREAASTGDIKKVIGLTKKGADGRDKFALIWAAQNGHDQVVAELIKQGANVNSKTADGGTNALTLAAQNGHLEAVKTLINAGADVNEPTIEGWTPLMKAAFFNHDGVIQTLLEAGADVHARNLQGLTAADLAEEIENRTILRLLNT